MSELDTNAAAALAERFGAFKDADPERLTIVPKESSADAHRPILERLGAPLDASGHKLADIQGADKRLAERMSAAFAEARLLPWQAKQIATAQMDFAKRQAEATFAQAQRETEREQSELAAEWKGQAAANTELAKRAARAARARGIDASAAIDYLESAIGYAATMRLMAKAGGFMIEGSFVDGAGGEVEPQGSTGGLLASYRATDAKMRR